MAVVIRLQGLPVSAGSADIRHFFTGLNVPDGGVHIIGGEFGEAFIIFATDEDARHAMSRSGGFIKQSNIQLYLSSKREMQDTIEMNRKKNRSGREPIPGTRSYASNIPGATGDENFSNLVASVKKERNKTGSVPSNCYNQSGETQQFNSDDLYLFLRGMPYSATEEEVRTFFHGLHVDGIIFLEHHSGPNIGRKNGSGLVKFATHKDAFEGLKRHKQYMGTRFIEITKATKEKWKENSDFVVTDLCPTHNQHGDRSSSLEQNSKNGRPRSRSPHNLEFYVHIKDMPYDVEKKDVKSFFQNLDVSDNQIKLLCNNYHNKTRDGFVKFKNEKDYRTALSLHKQVLNNHIVSIFPIGRKSMLNLIEKNEATIKGKPVDECMLGSSFQDPISKPGFYIHIRNFPFDITKVEVKKFFVGFSLIDDDICLLYDEQGMGLGEALVMFCSEELAAHAEKLNRQRFLGMEVLLQRISEAQVKEFDINAFPGKSSDKIQDQALAYSVDQYSHSGNSRIPSVQTFGASDFRYGPEEQIASSDYFGGPHPCVDFGGNRFATRNNGIEGISEGRIKFDHDIGINSTGPAVIQLKNIPFTTTVNEILDFFYGYRMIPDSVSIHYNESGLPTGIATIAMENAGEAMTAVQELNDRPVGPRKVKLNLI
ncbi:LOW QUALITY PROTEIN: RNA-binding protein 12B-like [Rhinatrema bivittatum]|uniref:LOW QUALITY PROTEIN: RNA-binding protein 12B-like n=1 Tax=Rhinatrema bivittatum TaxID=194408 RepID=UPI001125DA73|nr:LOW QUALITY PROTEIN: RNA-binding protein 12B-like [Rhinatrema bivittatum]